MNVAFTDLGLEDQELLKRALDVRPRAYAPYSDFLVGAAVRTRSGSVFVGCNVENASFGLSVCAEVSSLMAAVSAGDAEVQAIAIVGGPRLGSTGIVTPCGRCRQWIAEFAMAAAADIRVVAADVSLAEIDQRLISELLPGAFRLPQAGPPEASR